MRTMRLVMQAQWVTMWELYFIAKNAHMVSHNAQTNLVCIWSITYINCLRAFWCNGWSYGCILSSSKPQRWAELAKPDWQLDTNHIMTMTWLSPETISEWITLPSHIYIKCSSTSDAVGSHMDASLLEDKGWGQGQGTKKKKRTRNSDKGGQGMTTTLDKEQWWVWGQWGWWTMMRDNGEYEDYQDEGQQQGTMARRRRG